VPKTNQANRPIGYRAVRIALNVAAPVACIDYGRNYKKRISQSSKYRNPVLQTIAHKTRYRHVADTVSGTGGRAPRLFGFGTQRYGYHLRSQGSVTCFWQTRLYPLQHSPIAIPEVNMMKTACSAIDEYIAQFPEGIQVICQKLRETIRSAAPDATEKISYGLATFYEGENLIHFGVMKNHIGLYPTSSGVAAFADRLKSYRTTKGAIQFPLKDPIPYSLVYDIAAFRVREAREHAKLCP